MKDAVGILGITMMAAGLSARYGWELACIIIGGLLLALTIIGAMRK